MSLRRTPGRRARWLLASALVALVTSALPPAPAGAGSSDWIAPVPGRVVSEYEEPPAPFASGHRGVDFAAPSGSPVRATNAGTVTFAGSVAGALHVVIAHDNGIRTSYSYLTRIDIGVGATVKRGQVVGTAGGAGSGHGPGVLHFGARIGDRYIDPMLLFGPTDLTKLVRLVPVDGTTMSDEEALLLFTGDGDDDCAGGLLLVEQLCDLGEAVGGAAVDAASWAWNRAEEAVSLGLDALRALGEAGADLAERIAPVVRAVLQQVRDVANHVAGAAEALAVSVANGAVELFNEVVEAGLELIEALTSCPQPTPVAHPRGSGNIVYAVGGLGSSRHRNGRRNGRNRFTRSFNFQSEALGYARGDVGFYSYAPGSRAYSAEDTYGDLHTKARQLGTQLKRFAREHPGRGVDLVGHSQGGVVIDLFLMEVYAGHEDEYPPIENVVTFASPHQGTPLADLEQAVNEHLVLGPIARTAAPKMPLGAVSVAQLAESSPTMRSLWADGGVPASVRFLSIVGAEDGVVPSSSSDVPGGTKIVVPVGSTLVPDDHRNVLTDDDAISAAQSHLGGGSPANSCGPFTDVGGELYSTVIRLTTSAVSGTVPTGVPEELVP